MAFGTSLNFTSANEDGATELSALALSGTDHVLCLTASGTRPLDLLVAGPQRITALDNNPSQNELLRLKIAAIRVLDDDDLFAYLGLRTGPDRLMLHETVEKALRDRSRAFWQARRRLIARGVWYQGRWERVLRAGAVGMGLWRGGSVARLFAAQDLDAQARIWREEFDGPAWHRMLRITANRWFWTRIVGEPGGAFLPPPAEAAALVAGRFRRASASFLFRESDFLTLLFKGRCEPVGALPLHLATGNLALVRSRLDRIDVADGDLAALDRSPRFDAFSLSDFGSYTDRASYEACWAGVRRSALPSARFCERVLLNELAPPRFAHVDERLSACLSTADKAAIYDVRAGSLEG